MSAGLVWLSELHVTGQRTWRKKRQERLAPTPGFTAVGDWLRPLGIASIQVAGTYRSPRPLHPATASWIDTGARSCSACTAMCVTPLARAGSCHTTPPQGSQAPPREASRSPWAAAPHPPLATSPHTCGAAGKRPLGALRLSHTA